MGKTGAKPNNEETQKESPEPVPKKPDAKKRVAKKPAKNENSGPAC